VDEQQIPALIVMTRQDPQAFQPIFQHYYPRVFAYVAYRVGRAEDAEDIVAEVFMRVVNYLHQFTDRGGGSFSAWVFRIASNEVNRFFASHHRREGIPLDELPHILSDQLPVDVQVQRKEEFAHLRTLIGQLSTRRQEIVQLKFFGGLRNQEIAEIMGLDERTVASHLSRALDDLRRAYAQHFVEEG
jgi:RNA polymerase sigma-70 factor (ECF subfamily)